MTYDPVVNYVLHAECLGLWQATKALRGMDQSELADRLEDEKWEELKDCYVYTTDREERLESLRKQKRSLMDKYVALRIDEEAYRPKVTALVEQMKEVESTPEKAPHIPRWWPNKGERPVLVCTRCFIEPMPERFFPEMLEDIRV